MSEKPHRPEAGEELVKQQLITREELDAAREEIRGLKQAPQGESDLEAMDARIKNRDVLIEELEAKLQNLMTLQDEVNRILALDDVLIDYFEDRLVIKLLDSIHAMLAPGGTVILGNFHPQNPDRGIMECFLEWNLIHRSEEDMERLFAASAFGAGSVEIVFEEEGVNLFAIARKEG